MPPLTVETLVGTSLVVRGDVNASGHDSGYIQTYYALGAGAALAFYVGFLLLSLSTIVRRSDRLPLLVFLLSLFVIEVKEPFLFKYSAPLAFVLALLATRRSPQRPNLVHGSPA